MQIHEQTATLLQTDLGLMQTLGAHQNTFQQFKVLFSSKNLNQNLLINALFFEKKKNCQILRAPPPDLCSLAASKSALEMLTPHTAIKLSKFAQICCPLKS